MEYYQQSRNRWPCLLPLASLCCMQRQTSPKRTDVQGEQLTCDDGQLFSSLFADYNANNHREQFYPSRKHLLQACVPYYIIAERQHSESVSNKRRLASLESQLAVPSSRYTAGQQFGFFVGQLTLTYGLCC